MNLNDLWGLKGIDPEQVLVLRHRPSEPRLHKVLPWLAAEKPDVFNAYQQTQTEKVENAMRGASYVASFIGHQPGKAIFVGLYSVGVSKPLTRDEFWQVPAHIEMKEFGMKGYTEADGRPFILWFELLPAEAYASWKGKLVVSWPPPERSWWRRSHRNDIPVTAILEESILDSAMPGWQQIVLGWAELRILPTRWKSALEQWRGIYYIFDASDGKAYVGSAYGGSNLLGRWQNYAASGHGGNTLLRQRDPRHFQFSILQRASPDMEPNQVVQLEASWKNRLHTRQPWGLNDN